MHDFDTLAAAAAMIVSWGIVEFAHLVYDLLRSRE